MRGEARAGEGAMANDKEVSGTVGVEVVVNVSQTPCGDLYERPTVLDLGTVRRMTRGSSSGGHTDANSQFYR
jgi:hypothetical protein